MRKIAHVVRTLHVWLVPPQEGNSATSASVLAVLVLFVIWLLAAGQELLPAVTAAVVLSWSADQATRTREVRA